MRGPDSGYIKPNPSEGSIYLKLGVKKMTDRKITFQDCDSIVISYERTQGGKPCEAQLSRKLIVADVQDLHMINIHHIAHQGTAVWPFRTPKTTSA